MDRSAQGLGNESSLAGGEERRHRENGVRTV